MTSEKNIRVAALIPARGGSKRIPGKNLKSLGNIPLLQWSIDLAKEIGWKCWVSSDDADILGSAMASKVNHIKRPLELCTDTAGDLEVITHALKFINCDYLVYLRPTTPFRKADVCARALVDLIKSGADSMRSVEEMDESAYKCFEMFGSWLRPVWWGDVPEDLTDVPNQQCPKTYHPNGYIDIVLPEIVAKGGLWGNRRMSFEWPKIDPETGKKDLVVELDTMEQWAYAEYLIERGKV